MNQINPITWEREYNDNELSGQWDEGNEPVLSIEDQNKIDAQKAHDEAMRQAKRNKEKGEQSAWTRAKLETLAFRWAHKRKSPNKDPNEYKLRPGGIKQNLEKIDPIMSSSERFGDPFEFRTDLNIITNGFKNEKIVLEGNEMQTINEEGRKFLYGLLLQRHIFENDYSITIDDKNQPQLHDESWDISPARAKQTEGLQSVLKSKEFSINHWHILKKNDNSSLTAEYIAANVYPEHPDLVNYRDSLFRKAGITGDVTNLEATRRTIEQSSLNTKEKSFLLAWRDTRKDDLLTNTIQKNQETFVKNAKENFNQNSPDTNTKELLDHPFTKSAQMLAMGAIGAALLVYAFKQINKWGVWGTISGLIAGLIGGSIMLPIGDKIWQAGGLGEKLSDIYEWKPIDRSEAVDNHMARINMSIIAPIQQRWERFQARMAGGQEGIKILTNKKVGQKIATEYPVYSMLNTLNPDDSRIWGIYEAPVVMPGINPSDIKKWFENLSQPEQPTQLNTLLKDTWERYQKTQKFTENGGRDKAKTTNLADMLAAIETEDGWLNTAIDFVSDEPERRAAMKVIGQNPAAWGDISMGDIKKYFKNIPPQPADWINNHPISSLISDYNTKSKNTQTLNTILIPYFEKLDVSKASDSMKFRDFLSKP